jgi:hypothetical protein
MLARSRNYFDRLVALDLSDRAVPYARNGCRCDDAARDDSLGSIALRHRTLFIGPVVRARHTLAVLALGDTSAERAARWDTDLHRWK